MTLRPVPVACTVQGVSSMCLTCGVLIVQEPDCTTDAVESAAPEETVCLPSRAEEEPVSVSGQPASLVSFALTALSCLQCFAPALARPAVTMAVAASVKTLAAAAAVAFVCC